MISRKVARELHTKPSVRNNLGNRGVQESQVSILWNCGLWAHHVGFFIGAVTSCTVMIARHVREYPVSYVGNTLVPRARDEENHFPARSNEADH